MNNVTLGAYNLDFYLERLTQQALERIKLLTEFLLGNFARFARLIYQKLLKRIGELTPNFAGTKFVGHFAQHIDLFFDLLNNVAGGANVVCFTTGRGSVFGCKPSPSLKLATNSRMYGHMEDDMDVNCGTIVDGTETVADAGERIFRLILETASGKRSKSEALGFGEDEFAPWVIGATM